MKTFLSLLILSLSLPSLSFPGLLNRAEAAEKPFQSAEIEKAITEYYSMFSSEGTDLAEIDRAELASAVADEIVILKPVHFNSVTAFLIRDYRQKPEQRAAIEALLKPVRSGVQSELEASRNHREVMTVIDDVFRVWTAAYTVGFGKGLLASRGSGLQGIARFRDVVRSVTENLPSMRKSAFIAVGVGTPIGIAHAIYQHMQTQKLDPAMLLRSAQSAIIDDWKNRLTELQRGEATMSPDQVSTILDQADAELKQLYDTAAPLRAQMKPLARQIEAIRSP